MVFFLYAYLVTCADVLCIYIYTFYIWTGLGMSFLWSMTSFANTGCYIHTTVCVYIYTCVCMLFVCFFFILYIYISFRGRWALLPLGSPSWRRNRSLTSTRLDEPSHWDADLQVRHWTRAMGDNHWQKGFSRFVADKEPAGTAWSFQSQSCAKACLQQEEEGLCRWCFYIEERIEGLHHVGSTPQRRARAVDDYIRQWAGASSDVAQASSQRGRCGMPKSSGPPSPTWWHHEGSIGKWGWRWWGRTGVRSRRVLRSRSPRDGRWTVWHGEWPGAGWHGEWFFSFGRQRWRDWPTTSFASTVWHHDHQGQVVPPEASLDWLRERRLVWAAQTHHRMQHRVSCHDKAVARILSLSEHQPHLELNLGPAHQSFWKGIDFDYHSRRAGDTLRFAPKGQTLGATAEESARCCGNVIGIYYHSLYIYIQYIYIYTIYIYRLLEHLCKHILLLRQILWFVQTKLCWCNVAGATRSFMGPAVSVWLLPSAHLRTHTHAYFFFYLHTCSQIYSIRMSLFPACILLHVYIPMCLYIYTVFYLCL